jgi:Phage integrase, N-terminal SAM-like domain.
MSPDSQDRNSPRLLDQVRELIRIRHSIRTEQAYVQWIKRFILFHDKRHPLELGADEVTGFLSHLAVKRNVAASTQNQALNAIFFLVLNRGGRGVVSPFKTIARLGLGIWRAPVRSRGEGPQSRIRVYCLTAFDRVL